MNRIRSTAIVAGLALAAFSAFAQAPAGQQVSVSPAPAADAIPPDQQATQDQIEKFFAVVRLRQQMESMMGMMPQVVSQAYHAEMKSINEKLPPGKKLMPQDQAALEKVMNKYMQQAMNIYPIDQMIADAVPVYQRHISRADADALIAFYGSPAGQHILDAQPVIMHEYMGIVMGNMQNRSRRLTDEMNAEMEKVVQPDLSNGGSSPAKSE